VIGSVCKIGRGGGVRTWDRRGESGGWLCRHLCTLGKLECQCTDDEKILVKRGMPSV